MNDTITRRAHDNWMIYLMRKLREKEYPSPDGMTRYGVFRLGTKTLHPGETQEVPGVVEAWSLGPWGNIGGHGGHVHHVPLPLDTLRIVAYRKNKIDGVWTYDQSDPYNTTYICDPVGNVYPTTLLYDGVIKTIPEFIKRYNEVNIEVMKDDTYRHLYLHDKPQSVPIRLKNLSEETESLISKFIQKRIDRVIQNSKNKSKRSKMRTTKSKQRKRRGNQKCRSRVIK